MIEDITIGQYVPGNSPIHKLDPRTKLSTVLVYMVALFVVNTFTGYLLVGLFTAAIIALSALPLRFVLRGLRPLLVILIFTLVLNIFLTPGEVLAQAGPVAVTREGLLRGTFMALRLVFLVLGTSLLTLTTSPISLTDGLERLLAPGKRIGIPAHELAMMMSIALRFIPTLIEETQKIMKAQAARGADFESGNVFHRARNMVPLLVPLFVSAFRRADDLALAMEARCYRGGEGRTRMKEMHMSGRDFAALAVMFVFTAVAIYTRTLGGKVF